MEGRVEVCKQKLLVASLRGAGIEESALSAHPLNTLADPDADVAVAADAAVYAVDADAADADAERTALREFALACAHAIKHKEPGFAHATTAELCEAAKLRAHANAVASHPPGTAKRPVRTQLLARLEALSLQIDGTVMAAGPLVCKHPATLEGLRVALEHGRICTVEELKFGLYRVYADCVAELVVQESPDLGEVQAEFELVRASMRTGKRKGRPQLPVKKRRRR